MQGRSQLWAAGLVLFGCLAGLAHADDHPTAASVLVVQGTVETGENTENAIDILVDDDLCALSGVRSGDILGPMPFEPRWYSFKIGPADAAAPCSAAPILEAWVLFKEGESVSLVAHRGPRGALRLVKFSNDVGAMEPGTSRTIVHHVARLGRTGFALQRQSNEQVDPVEEQDTTRTVETPTWDDLVHTDGDDVIMADLTCGKKSTARLRSGQWDLWTFDDGEMDPFAGPMRIKTKPYTVTLVFAVGSDETDTYRVLQKELRVNARGNRDLMDEEPPEPGNREREVITFPLFGGD